MTPTSTRQNLPDGCLTRPQETRNATRRRGHHKRGRLSTPRPAERTRVRKPQPGANQVLVRVVAAGLNPADANIRAGRFKQIMRQPFPIVPGSDMAGQIERVGGDAMRFKTGDAVYGLTKTYRCWSRTSRRPWRPRRTSCSQNTPDGRSRFDVVSGIHASLHERELLPDEDLVDLGDIGATQLDEATREYGIGLVGSPRQD